jgi:hypothetical protein
MTDARPRPATLGDVKAGDTLWYVPHISYRGSQRELTITKVGRIWASTGDRIPTRIHKRTLEVNGEGFSSPGRCFRSRDHYERWKVAVDVWNRLRRRMNDCPPDVTEQRVRQAAALLGVEIDAA